jgi:hypothetical protein
MNKQKILKALPEKLSYKTFSREKLASWLKIKNFTKIPKDILIADTMKSLKENKNSIEFFCKRFGEELSFSPYMAEKILKIDSKTRILLTKNNMLQIWGYETFRKYGKDLQSPLYDFSDIICLTNEQIKNKLVQIKKQKEIKKKNNSNIVKEKTKITKEYIENYKNIQYANNLINNKKLFKKLI